MRSRDQNHILKIGNTVNHRFRPIMDDDQPLINYLATKSDEDLLKDRLDCDDPDLELEEVEKRGKSLADEFLKSEIEEGLKKANQFNNVILLP